MKWAQFPELAESDIEQALQQSVTFERSVSPIPVSVPGYDDEHNIVASVVEIVTTTGIDLVKFPVVARLARWSRNNIKLLDEGMAMFDTAPNQTIGSQRLEGVLKILI